MTSFLTAARSEQEQMTPDSRRLRLFSGTSNSALAKEISAYLGVPDGPRVCKRFADGELYVQIQGPWNGPARRQDGLSWLGWIPDEQHPEQSECVDVLARRLQLRSPA